MPLFLFKLISIKMIKQKIIQLIILITALTQVATAQSPSSEEAIVKITLVDKDDIPEPDALVILEDIDSKQKYQGRTDSLGKLEILAPQGNSYHTICSLYNKRFVFDEILEIPSFGKPLKLNYDLKVVDLIFYKGIFAQTYILENVYFESNSSSLKNESYKAIDDLYEAMKARLTMEIEIAGHTDSDGDDIYNQKLSQYRANSIKNYLISKGIQAERIKAKGYGEAQPIASNDSEEGKKRNRRIEVRVIKE